MAVHLLQSEMKVGAQYLLYSDYPVVKSFYSVYSKISEKLVSNDRLLSLYFMLYHGPKVIRQTNVISILMLRQRLTLKQR